MRSGGAVGAVLLAVFAVGCQTSPKVVFSIPVTRDYQDLPAVSVEEAARTVAEARRAGAAHSAPYEYYSAEQYLETARRQKGAAARDYASLAKSMAEAALRREPAMEQAEAPSAPGSEQAARAEFDRLHARYLELDKDKAIEVAPVLYARLTAELSRAEHALGGGGKGWKEAARLLPLAATDIDTLLWQDTDGDGVPDMLDGAPFDAEDVDGFQDEDGVPDPDNDNDGIPDVIDKAPNAPETRNRYHDDDGAPDELPQLESIYFAEGSTQLSADAQGYLRGLRELLAEWPELRLRIQGYADNIHSETYSMEVSQRRAQEVLRYMTGLGIPAERIVATYHGALPGAAANADAAAGNRVDLILE
jgi:outer membrane protein OmpA-like peptidoglycan-associated protein